MFTSDELREIQDARREWEQTVLEPVKARWPERHAAFSTASDIPVKRFYTPEDVPDQQYLRDLNFPGGYPFTRGVQPTGYRGRLWTVREVTGFATPEETNRRLKFLIEQGETGLNVVFDLPTQSMLASDNPRCEGEVGRDGVPVDTLRDVERIFQDIDIAEISTSLITGGPFILAMFLALAEKRGIPADRLRGTLQNDMVSTYYTVNARGLPLPDTFRLSLDVIEYCRRELPRWNPISFVGYQIREAGCTATQELAFTLASGIAYTRALMDRGMDVDDFAPRFSFFFNAHNDFFEEVCKFRAARRLWARIMREDFGAQNPLSWLLRFHVQTAGSSLTAQQPVNNVVRTTLQALAAVLGGANSLHTNSMDEALSLPTEAAVATALRTQQIIAQESGVTNTVDPLGGSYFVEQLTNQLETTAREILDNIAAQGGMVSAVTSGWVQREIAEAARTYQQEVQSGERTVVGVNAFTGGEEQPIEVLHIDPAFEAQQCAAVAEVRAQRDASAVRRALASVKRSIADSDNVMPAFIEAAHAYATIEEMGQAVQDALGVTAEGGGAVARL